MMMESGIEENEKIAICEGIMYTIKTENFILTLTPVANSVMIDVWSEGFSAESCFDTEEILIAGFVSQLNEMYQKLDGSAIIQDLYETDSYIEFIAQKRGHITVRGKITRSRNRYTQQLTFENEIEQTYLRDFVSALTADYAKYAEQ